jgi:hypothetical protein
MSTGYLSLVSKAGRTGEHIPCRYAIIRDYFAYPEDGIGMVLAVPPEYGPVTRWTIRRRNQRDATQRHALGLFVPGGRLMGVVRDLTAAGDGATYSLIWQHRTDDLWYCAPRYPGAIEVNS